MNLDERLKKAQRLEKIPTYYLSEYIWRVLIIQKFILIPLTKTSITPNQVTAMGGIFVILSFLSLYLGHNVIAGFCYLAYSILDHTDGILARYKNLKSKLVLQVHDELVIDTHPDEVEAVKNILKTVMENVVKLKVKLLTSVEVGDTWYDAH